MECARSSPSSQIRNLVRGILLLLLRPIASFSPAGILLTGRSVQFLRRIDYFPLPSATFLCSTSFKDRIRNRCSSAIESNAILDRLGASGMPLSTLEKLVSLGSDQVKTILLDDFHIPSNETQIILQALEFNSDNQSSSSGSSEESVDETPAVQHQTKPPLYKNVVLSPLARQRKNDDYGLTVKGLERQFPTLYQEYQDWNSYMTLPNQFGRHEPPIREATASTYLRHARLFWGWYTSRTETQDRDDHHNPDLSLYTIIPDSSKESVQPILHFLRFLNEERQASHSYQANILRGLVKLTKYRFRTIDSQDELDKLPILMELRKQHRQANQQPVVRTSNEDLKWLSWPEFLGVVNTLKQEVQARKTSNENPKQTANMYQKYLILAIFASIPDRQRTVRELVIEKSFVKKDGQWCIQHRPQDYKTGKTYGMRPLLRLNTQMTADIDDFIHRWRSFLLPKTDHLFCQVRTGQPLTQDSVYQIVARTCFQYTGKRTNPHLLRDMIVTHVRGNSEATEAQLEALALYMGHSLAVQRASYDRRTLSQKVEPAIDLLEKLNDIESQS